MDATYSTRNDAARSRLQALVERLTPADLDRPLGDGWTVKAALMHLAFWDRLAAAAVEQWQRTGVAPWGEDAPYINVAGLNDWLAAAPAYALREVLSAAELADRAAADIGEALRAEILARGESWVCERGIHRAEHVEQVELALKPAS